MHHKYYNETFLIIIIINVIDNLSFYKKIRESIKIVIYYNHIV